MFELILSRICLIIAIVGLVIMILYAIALTCVLIKKIRGEL